jgi:hypothetical protein
LTRIKFDQHLMRKPEEVMKNMKNRF